MSAEIGWTGEIREMSRMTAELQEDVAELQEYIEKFKTGVQRFGSAYDMAVMYDASILGISVDGRMDFAIVPNDTGYAKMLRMKFKTKYPRHPGDICVVERLS
jgi:hypothetical protein